MNKLINYLPQFLKNIREYKEIYSSEDIEINELDNKLKEVLNEFTVETAKGYGLAKYEKMLNITNNTTNIDQRRFKIKSKLTNQLPFNYSWLENKLKSLVGEGNYIINLDSQNYTVKIMISYLFPNIENIIRQDFIKQLPANLIININLFQTEMSDLFFGAKLRYGDFIKIGGVD